MMTVPQIRYGNHTYFFLCLGHSVDDIREKPDEAEDALLDLNADWKAIGFLRRVAAWDLGLRTLRQVAMTAGVNHPWLQPEADLIDIVAGLLTADRVAVIDRYWPGGAGAPGEEPKPAVARPAAPPTAVRSDPEPEEPPTFSCELYQDQQAAALIAAAQSGVPFCEECCKAAAAARAA